MGDEYFKVSSGLKTLLGSELITDNLVAVFELVKNSFDAQAKVVNIRFENIYKSDAKIIISDDGEGMNYKDLKDKWLFVAYSSKREEIQLEDSKDYRDKINAHRYYAGAKGVGRFSCDRLGSILNLITIKKENNSKIENLFIDWSKFDENQLKLLEKIPAIHKVLDKTPYKLKHGTILEISQVHKEEWNRENLLKLKDRLSKLVKPDLNKAANEKPFKIYLDAPDEFDNDEKATDKYSSEGEGSVYRETVNGEIKNFIFEQLEIKTTKIDTRIIDNGSKIITELSDRGERIYTITEKNEFGKLQNITIVLYFLSRSAKLTFTQRMGVQPINYGNVFVYKNGFRILPFGEPRDDSMGIDARALQGIARYLGTRNLIGQIEIHGNAKDLRETTSRDGGIVKTKAYDQLKDYFFVTLRRLEKFVVDVANWGIEDDSLKDLSDRQYKDGLVKLIANITEDKGIIDLNYNDELVKMLVTQEEGSAKKLIKNFKRIASDSKNPTLLKDAEKLEKKWSGLVQAKDSAEKESEKAKKGEALAKEELHETVSQNLFLKSVSTTDIKEVISLQHHINHASHRINQNLEQLKQAINKNESKDELFKHIDIISLENQKISTISRFVTKANFNLMSTTITRDIVNFINEYIENVYKEYSHLRINNQKLNINVKTNNKELITKFKPLEVIIIIDNLLSNAIKANAKNVKVNFDSDSNNLKLTISDDGKGIPEKNINKVFDFGFTTTSGSGLGLYHVKQIIEKMGGKIDVDNNYKNGTSFILTLKK